PASCPPADLLRASLPQLSAPPQELILTRTAIVTTARRGHTPAAHGRSSSPPLLSLACGLQHKLTPRQQRRKAKRRDKSHSHATATSGSTQATHNKMRQLESVQLQNSHTSPQARS
ncbi:hypothetical protein TcCL_Unassigned00594, partial [Trypanosoma cruzi]